MGWDANERQKQRKRGTYETMDRSEMWKLMKKDPDSPYFGATFETHGHNVPIDEILSKTVRAYEGGKDKANFYITGTRSDPTNNDERRLKVFYDKGYSKDMMKEAFWRLPTFDKEEWYMDYHTNEEDIEDGISDSDDDWDMPKIVYHPSGGRRSWTPERGWESSYYNIGRF